MGNPIELQVELQPVLAKTTNRWMEAEQQRLLLEVKLEQVLAENEKLQQQIKEMIAAQVIKEGLNGKSVRERPADALEIEPVV